MGFNCLYYLTGEVEIHHLASVEVTKADAVTLFNVIVNVIEGNKIPWSNLLSVVSPHG